jgi:hypothetical protein
MKHAKTVALMLGVAGFALVAMSGDRTYSQANDPNGAPNPYKMEENWAQLPAGRKMGSAIGVEVDKDGKSVWVFDRCGSNTCANSPLNPIEKFDPNGNFVTAFGANIFNVPHGLGVDRDGNVYASDQTTNNGRGAVVVKFSPTGQILMVLGHLGQPGNGRDFLSMPTDVAIAPNGDIYVTDGHGGASNDRVVKYNKDGHFITHGSRHDDRAQRDRPRAAARRIPDRSRPHRAPAPWLSPLPGRARPKAAARGPHRRCRRRRHLRRSHRELERNPPPTRPRGSLVVDRQSLPPRQRTRRT